MGVVVARNGDLELVVDRVGDTVGSIMDTTTGDIWHNRFVPSVISKVGWQPVVITFKHMPGKHDQRLHAPHKYRSSHDDAADLADPNSKLNREARENWKSLSHDERMALMDADAVDMRMAQELSRYRTEYDEPHDVGRGELKSTKLEHIRENAHARIDSLQEALTPETEQKMRDYVDKYMVPTMQQATDEGWAADAADVNKMMSDNVDRLVFQEIESRKRQLGDHGIRHVLGNVEMANTILDDPDMPQTTAMDRLLVNQALVIHDMGYTAGVVTQSFEATKYHELYSEKYAKQRGFDKLYGTAGASELNRMVRTHAHTDLNWQSDPLASAVRTADNLSLFSKEKMPALFHEVPGATGELYRLQLAQVAGRGGDMLPQVKSNLHRLVDETDIDPRVKSELHSAADEVFPLSGKFTLGMEAGELKSLDYDGKVLNVDVTAKPERTALNGVFDLGERQFGKFLEAYDTEGAPGSGLSLREKDTGEFVMRMTYKDVPPPSSGVGATFYNNSVRPLIRESERSLGANPSASQRTSYWNLLEPRLEKRLTPSELSQFKAQYDAGSLSVDGYPLTAAEERLLAAEVLKSLGLGWAIKHLPGRHDQKRHDPHRYRRTDVSPLDFKDGLDYAKAKLGYSYSEVYRGGMWVKRDDTISDDEHRELIQAERDWENEVYKAIGRGDVRAEFDARHRAVYLTGHAFDGDRVYLSEIQNAAEFGPLPDKLYHVTTAKSAVLAGDGVLKSRYDLEQERARGLGGGSENTISFTTDKAIAENIRDRMIEAKLVASGGIDLEELIAQAEEGNSAQEPWLHDWVKLETGSTGEIPDTFRLQGQGYEVESYPLGATSSDIRAAKSDPEHRLHSRFAGKEGHGDWSPVGDPSHKASSGEGVYYNWKRTRPQEDTNQWTFDRYKSWLGFREYAGGPENPVFWGTDARYLASVDADEIAILEYKPKPGAMGVKKSALGEWRTWDGTVLELEDVE